MYTITDKYKLLFSLTPLLIQEQPGHLPPLQPGTCWPLFTIREVTLEVNFVPVKISCRCCCSGGNVEITWPQEMGDNKSSFLFLQTANTAFLDHSACGPYLWLALLLILSLKAMRKYTWTTSAFLHLYSTYRGYITALGGLIFMKTTGSPFLSMQIVLQTNGGKGIMHGVHAAERQGWIQSPKCMHNWVPISLVFASCWNSCFWRSEFLMVVAVVIKFVSCQYPLFLKLVGTSKLRNRDLRISRGKIQNASVNMWCIPSQQTIIVQEFAHHVVYIKTDLTFFAWI